MSIVLKQTLFSLIILLFSYDAFAQVAKNVIVEHFTNTRCGICSFRNPAFFENLNEHEDVLHITYHPSRPYPTCELYKHNPTENDGRTIYYDVYSGTPRLVIQGIAVSANTDYSDKAIFEPHQAQTSPVSISLEQAMLDASTIETKITITNEMEHDLSAVKIFVGIAEKRLQYDAPNGEKEHFDVFRKAYTTIEGESIALEKTKGANAELSYQIPLNETWVSEELFSFAILQMDDTKAVIQSAVSPVGEFSMPVNTTDIQQSPIIISPNPVNDILHIVMPNNETSELRLFDSNGKLHMHKKINEQSDIAIPTLPKGLYFAELTQNGQRFQQKVLKK